MLAAKMPLLPKGAGKTAVTPQESDEDGVTRKDSAEQPKFEAPGC